MCERRERGKIRVHTWIALALAVVLTPLPGLGTRPCFAHPVPRSEYDRNLTVTWHADAVHILYRVEIDEYTLLTTVGNAANGFPLDLKKRVGRKEIADAYIAKMRAVIPDMIQAEIDGRKLEFTCPDARVDFTDSAQFRFRLKASARLAGGEHKLVVEDLNFIDFKGKLVMKFEAGDSLRTVKVSEPPEGRLLEVTEAERRTLSATVVIPSVPSPAPATEAPWADDPAAMKSPVGFWDTIKRVEADESLAVLLDSDVGLWLVLLVALVHGVLHSVAPGHGKTMVAAYLVGEQGTPRHAVILGLVVTLTHTSAAFAVAMLLKFVLPPTAAPTVQRVLGIGGGLLVALVGFWLLMQRLSGRSDHVHVGSQGHGHSHADGSHSHSHGVTPEQFARVGWLRLIVLGISGGIVPCWGAILWVIYCVTAGRYGLAIWAVLAFSVGLACVLILLGLSVVWTGRMGARRFSNRGWFHRVTKWLPIVGAALVMVIGLWLVQINIK